MRKQDRMVRKLARLSAALLLGVSMPACGQSSDIHALEMLASKKSPKAIYHLGMMYLTGTSVEQDQQRALAYFRESAALGDPLASYKMGCFYDGQYELVEPDADLALEHKLVAAEAGYALAQSDVARLFYDKGDIGSALLWLERAVAQGTPEALSTYASIHNGAPGIAKDAAKTTVYFTLLLERTGGGSTAQRKWLNDFSSKLSDDERTRVAAIVAGYAPRPSALTIEALSGARAVETIIRASS